MDIQEAIAKAQDAITVNRVYGEPYHAKASSSFPPPRSEAVGVAVVGLTPTRNRRAAVAGTASTPVPWARTWSRQGASDGSPRSTSRESLCARW
jgi:hypothetical protein